MYRSMNIKSLTLCVFWPNPITHSGTFRSPNLALTDHRFWFYSIIFSGFPESMIGMPELVIRYFQNAS
jgi:hypothetical protein